VLERAGFTPALGSEREHQLRFRREVGLRRAVEVEMVAREVGEHADVGTPLSSDAGGQRLRRHLDGDRLDAASHGALDRGQELVDQVGTRHPLVLDPCADRGDPSIWLSGRGHDRRDHGGRGGLAVGAGDGHRAKAGVRCGQACRDHQRGR